MRRTDAERRAAFRAFAAGTTTREIAETLGVPRRTVAGWLAAEGLRRPLRMPPRRHDDATRTAALRLYARGMSCRAVAEALGDVSYPTVGRWVYAARVSRLPGRAAGGAAR